MCVKLVINLRRFATPEKRYCKKRPAYAVGGYTRSLKCANVHKNTTVHVIDQQFSSIHYAFFSLSLRRSRHLVGSAEHVTSGRAIRRSTATTSMFSSHFARFREILSHLAISGGDSESSEYGVIWFSAAENSTTHEQVPAANVSPILCLHNRSNVNRYN